MNMKNALPRVIPEEKGVSSRKLLELIHKMDSIGNEVHGFMVERDGAVIAESWLKPYDASYPHTCHSLGKSYTCTAVGVAAQEGLLSPEDLVTDIFRDEIEKWGITPAPLFRKLRLKDMMSMADGAPRMSAFTEHWAEEYLKQDIVYEPGTHFLYNTVAACMIGRAVEKAVGRPLDEYLKEKLLRKIGIRDDEIVWLKFADGTCAEPGLSATTEANLRLAMFYLNDGEADGEQIISKEWIREATRAHLTRADGAEFDVNTTGYGWQLWICAHEDQFRFDGGQGQIAIADRRKNAVIAFHQGGHDPKGTTESISFAEHFFEEMEEGPLPADPEGVRLLREYLENRALPAGTVKPVPEEAKKHAGIYYLDEGSVNFWIEVNPFDADFYHLFYDYSVTRDTKTLAFDFEDNAVRMTVNGKSVYRLRLDGVQEAFDTEGGVIPELKKTCSTAYFEDADTLVVTVRNLNSWVVSKTVIRFSGADISLDMEKYMLHETLPPMYSSAKGRLIR